MSLGEPLLAFASLDRRFANPGAVTRTADGQLHALATRFNAFGGPSDVDHWASEDGRSWELVGPVLSTSDVPFSEHTVSGSSLVRDDEGWVLYFEAVQRSSGPAVIGRATAPGLDGPWRVHPQPVLTAGPEDGWDGDGVRTPSVLADEDGWHMWYVGLGGGTEAIGYATSPDGLAWQRHGDPVFSGGQDWDRGTVSGGQVVDRDGELVMLYDHAARAASSLGLATSTDGITWTPLEANPVVTGDDVDAGTFFQLGMTSLDDDRLLVLVEAGTSQGTDVHAILVDLPRN